MRSLKGKKRKRFKERFIDGNQKYQEAAKTLVRPKVGYGLASELRRAGVFVKMVADKPQAADWAVKRQMQHSLTRGIDWLVLVSDDSDFADMLRKARDSNLGTVVIGDWDGALGRHADLWVPWVGVENGEVSGEDLLATIGRRGDSLDMDDDETVSVMEFDGPGKLDEVMDELVGNRTNHWRIEEEEGNSRFQLRQFLDDDDEDEDFLSDSEDEETEENDWYTR